MFMTTLDYVETDPITPRVKSLGRLDGRTDELLRVVARIFDMPTSESFAVVAFLVSSTFFDFRSPANKDSVIRI